MSTPSQDLISGSSSAVDPAAAVAEFRAAVAQDDIALVVVFCSPEYDRDELARALAAEFSGINVIGCTSAGEISSAGLLNHSISGFSLSASAFKATLVPILGINAHGQTGLLPTTAQISQTISAQGLTAQNTFGFLLVDGLSVREEGLVGALHHSLGDISLCGGSAGDGLDFGSTWILSEGKWVTDAALFALITTDLPFSVFKSQHYTATEERIVITEADVSQRIVTEVNGGRAAEEYAEALGVTVDGLTPELLGTHPVMLNVDNTQFIRGVKEVNDDGSMSFFCAIEAGSVLTIGEGGGLVEALEASLEDVQTEIGELQAVIGCDCITRRLEIESNGLEDDIARVCAENNIVGFSTYGEQYNAMHVNQTFTGVAIGLKQANT